MDAKLNRKIIIKGKIIALSGIHVGGTNSAMAIGGVDKAVIRNPVDNKPYIPGSSLKGKMRSLIELKEGAIGEGYRNTQIDNGPSMDRAQIPARLFGTAMKPDQREEQRPSRVIFRDAQLLSSPEDLGETDLPYSEMKTEVVIDRITSVANPRQIERVPAGAEFGLEIVLNDFDEDKDFKLFKQLMMGLQLLQDDYIGGNGSRGSGQIKFEIEKVLERSAGFYRGEEEEKDLTDSAEIPDDLKATDE